jgi:hypothetical protein
LSVAALSLADLVNLADAPYLGSHGHLAVDLELRADEQGGLSLRSGAQRFCEGVLAFNFPMLSGEWERELPLWPG